MTDYYVVIGDFIKENWLLLVIAIGVLFIAIKLFKQPKEEKARDFVKEWSDKDIKSEELNKVEPTVGWKRIFRGSQFLGNVVSESTIPIKRAKLGKKVKKGDIVVDEKFDDDLEKAEETIVYKVVFKKAVFWRICLKKHMLLFSKADNFETKDQNLIFPSNTDFTVLGNKFLGNNTYPEISTAIIDDWKGRLLETEINAHANQMHSVAGFVVGHAHELSLKDKEIEKLREEKRLKGGSYA